jgi:LacI family transcriptional regulator
MMDRSVEGIIAIDTPLEHPLPMPAVVISGHRKIEGITNVILDHRRAAELALGHLVRMGHSEVAFMRGPVVSSDSEERWKSICEVARVLDLPMKPALCVDMEFSTPFPDMGYPVVQKMLASGQKFTALFAFNDVSAIGAIRALRDAGLRVPEDVAVIGFDDIPIASYNTPSLTTIRQPLRRMGEIAARSLLDRLQKKPSGPEEVAVEPELVIRESTTMRLRVPLRRGEMDAELTASASPPELS